MPVILATWEAETENCLNPGGRGCSEIAPLHFSLGDRGILHPKKKNKITGWKVAENRTAKESQTVTPQITH